MRWQKCPLRACRSGRFLPDGGGLLGGEKANSLQRTWIKRHYKNATLAGRALHLNVATHSPDETSADSQAKTGATGAARRRGVCLHEGLEDTGELVGRDADAAVGHFDEKLLLLV